MSYLLAALTLLTLGQDPAISKTPLARLCVTQAASGFARIPGGKARQLAHRPPRRRSRPTALLSPSTAKPACMYCPWPVARLA